MVECSRSSPPMTPPDPNPKTPKTGTVSRAGAATTARPATATPAPIATLGFTLGPWAVPLAVSRAFSRTTT